MKAVLKPSVLRGRLKAVPSKSEAHRLLVCAALADRPCALRLPSGPADIEATVRCLRALGAAFDRAGDTLRVTPTWRPVSNALLPCGESGSTLRFLLPVAAALGAPARFTGEGRLPERPLGELLDCLRARGAVFDREKLPLAVSGALSGGEFTLPGNVSSQYVTGLLLALPLLSEDSRIRLRSPLQSSGYVEMTLSALARFSVSVIRQTDGFFIPGGQRFRAPEGTVEVEGDWSNAAFFLAAGALGGAVTVTGLNPDSRQGDRVIADLLERFGARVRREGDAVTVSPGRLRGQTIDLGDIPDLLPPLAVVAAAADGETRFLNAARLRLKESDRLSAAAELLRALGAEAEEGPDFLTVRGGKRLRGGAADSRGDHRLAMAAALAAVLSDGDIVLENPAAVVKSYPDFFSDYQRMGGICHVF